MKVKCWGEEYKVKVFADCYRHGNNYAVVLTEEDGAPFATITVNLEGKKLPKGYAYVDVNNCPWAPDFIKEYKLGEPVGASAQSGYCVYPLYLFDTKIIPERR